MPLIEDFDETALAVAFTFNGVVTALAVLIHYQCLSWLTRLIPVLSLPHRFRIVVGVFGTLLAHLVEVWVFGVAFYWMNASTEWGHLGGNFSGSLLDCVYFSLTTFTTVGFGDIEPFGYIRFLAGIEALTGLLLITWSASFLFLEMQRFWRDQKH